MRSSWKSLAVACGALAVIQLSAARAAEWDHNTPYYEDDAWYDISEWFDGNDYNPTDEVAGRRDDETYSASQDTGSDEDNDNWYGYDSRSASGHSKNDTARNNNAKNNDWFYDYYDYRPSYANFNARQDTGRDVAYGYYDFDGDGYYDAYTYGIDRDGDGTFDAVGFYSLNEEGKRVGAKSAQNLAQTSRSRRISGTVEKTKRVNVGTSEHLLVGLEGGEYFVDLGPTNRIVGLDLQAGDHMSAHGPMVKIGSHKVLIADHARVGDQTLDIDRNGRSFKGEIAGIRQENVRGVKHQLAILADKNGSKRLLDLGAADQLDVKLHEGDRVSVTGVPVKMGDKQVILAEHLRVGKKDHPIDRSEAPPRNAQHDQARS